MPHLDINFEDTPDSIPSIEPGKYQCLITEVPTVEPNKAGTGNNLCVQLQIEHSEDGNVDFKGRKVRDFIPVATMQTKIKNLFQAAGLVPGATGAETEDLAGKSILCVLKTSPGNDPGVIFTNVAAYIPA